MLKGKLFLTVAGLVLGAAGLALFNFGATPQSTSAQSTNYDTDWSATKLFQVKYTNNGGGTRNTAAIGVAEWFVDGQIGTTSFTETWSAPTSEARLTAGANCSTHGYVQTDWLLGCFKVENDPGFGGNNSFELRVVDANSVYTSGNTTGARWSGGGVYCDNGSQGGPVVLDGCIVSTGSYGFTAIPGGSNAGDEIYFSGLMMPLKWHVAGTID